MLPGTGAATAGCPDGASALERLVLAIREVQAALAQIEALLDAEIDAATARVRARHAEILALNPPAPTTQGNPGSACSGSTESASSARRADPSPSRARRAPRRAAETPPAEKAKGRARTSSKAPEGVAAPDSDPLAGVKARPANVPPAPRSAHCKAHAAEGHQADCKQCQVAASLARVADRCLA